MNALATFAIVLVAIGGTMGCEEHTPTATTGADAAGADAAGADAAGADAVGADAAGADAAGADADGSDGSGACVPSRNDAWSPVLQSGGGPGCATCAQAQCCDELTTCDDGNLDPAGFTPCGEVLKCMVDYVTGAGAFMDGSTDAGPDFDAATSACIGLGDAKAQANAESALSCIRRDCSSDCSRL